MRWRMAEKCSDCPFHKKGPGAHLARSLRPGRMRDIKKGLLAGEHFHCHKTTGDEDEDGEVDTDHALVCAGAIEFQDANGVESNLVRVMRRLDAMDPDKRLATMEKMVELGDALERAGGDEMAGNVRKVIKKVRR